MKVLIKKHWWILLLIVIAGGAFYFLRHSAKKKAEATAQDQRRIDSLTVQVRMLDSLNRHRQLEIQVLEADKRAFVNAINEVNQQRKTESHAYHKNIATVRALPDDKQLDFFAGWLPAPDGSWKR